MAGREADCLISIEVIYATAEMSKIISLQVNQGTTLVQALEISGILSQFPEINLTAPKNPINRVGIYGKLKELNEIVQAGDRIEIYQPLPQSAIESRKARVKKQKFMRQRQALDRG